MGSNTLQNKKSDNQASAFVLPAHVSTNKLRADVGMSAMPQKGRGMKHDFQRQKTLPMVPNKNRPAPNVQK